MKIEQKKNFTVDFEFKGFFQENHGRNYKKLQEITLDVHMQLLLK